MVHISISTDVFDPFSSKCYLPSSADEFNPFPQNITTPVPTNISYPVPPSNASPIDCVVSNFTAWGTFSTFLMFIASAPFIISFVGSCSVSCGGGVQSRYRTIITDPLYGGQICPNLNESQPCNTQLCCMIFIHLSISRWILAFYPNFPRFCPSFKGDPQ